MIWDWTDILNCWFSWIGLSSALGNLEEELTRNSVDTFFLNCAKERNEIDVVWRAFEVKKSYWSRRIRPYVIARNVSNTKYFYLWFKLRSINGCHNSANYDFRALSRTLSSNLLTSIVGELKRLWCASNLAIYCTWCLNFHTKNLKIPLKFS